MNLNSSADLDEVYLDNFNVQLRSHKQLVAIQFNQFYSGTISNINIDINTKWHI